MLCSQLTIVRTRKLNITVFHRNAPKRHGRQITQQCKVLVDLRYMTAVMISAKDFLLSMPKTGPPQTSGKSPPSKHSSVFNQRCWQRTSVDGLWVLCSQDSRPQGCALTKESYCVLVRFCIPLCVFYIRVWGQSIKYHYRSDVWIYFLKISYLTVVNYSVCLVLSTLRVKVERWRQTHPSPLINMAETEKQSGNWHNLHISWS